MPNWCHNTLTLSGEPEAVGRFIEKVRLEVEEGGEKFEQPLTFSAHVPEPSDEEYAAMVEAQKVTCRLCGGRGKRPVTQEEADAWGVRFHEGVMEVLPFDDRRPCNGCNGTGRDAPFGAGWYDWRVEHWGTKWDASFSGPFLAMGDETADVEKSLEWQRAQQLDGNTTVYKFDTAWSPPLAWLAKVSEAEPDLKLTLAFGEPGNGVAGRVTFVGGVEVEAEDLEVTDVLEPEEMWF